MLCQDREEAKVAWSGTGSDPIFELNDSYSSLVKERFAFDLFSSESRSEPRLSSDIVVDHTRVGSPTLGPLRVRNVSINCH